MFKTFKTILAFAVSFSIVSISNSFADGHAGAIKKWSNAEFKLSVLSAKEREKELNWFHNAAKPFKGMSLKDISKNWALDKKFSPKMKNNNRTKMLKGWSKAIKRTLIN